MLKMESIASDWFFSSLDTQRVTPLEMHEIFIDKDPL